MAYSNLKDAVKRISQLEKENIQLRKENDKLKKAAPAKTASPSK